MKIGGFHYSLEVPGLTPFTVLATPVFSLSRFHLTIMLFVE